MLTLWIVDFLLLIDWKSAFSAAIHLRTHSICWLCDLFGQIWTTKLLPSGQEDPVLFLRMACCSADVCREDVFAKMAADLEMPEDDLAELLGDPLDSRLSRLHSVACRCRSLINR